MTEPAEPTRKKRRGGGLGRTVRRLSKGAENALEIMRMGRLGAPYSAPYEVATETRVAKLRHYRTAGQPDARLRPILLVPPLMVTSEVYDIAPELSAVQILGAAGLDVWLVDYGAPERTPGGLERTLDDHIHAIDEALDTITKTTGKDVHVAGYSQGGMFAYQVAAFRKSEGVASLITFGAPVDIRRSLPGVPAAITERLISGMARVLEKPLEALEALPGFMTSTGFKMMSVRKELEQVVDFVQKLHDRQALERRESRRRFLGGEGFVAWPGPAFRKFVDEFIVGNRLASGGFVVEGRTVTLADLTCPILYFVGLSDEIARAPAVRAIERAAPRAECHEVGVRAGHFGIVVGSKAVARTWPTVAEWVLWKDGVGSQPLALAPDKSHAPNEIDDEEFDDVPLDVDVFYDAAASALDVIIERAGGAAEQAAQIIDNLRWQVPRLAKLRRVGPDTKIGMAKALAEQAASIPDATFFLYKGRAFSYKDANQRVDRVVRGLIHCGVRHGTKVGVLMDPRPSYLSIVTALNRMGAVAVLLGPDSTRATLAQAITLSGMEMLVTDPSHAADARQAFEGPVLSLGGFGERRELPGGVLDMEAIDEASVRLPEWYTPDDARGSDLAMIIFTAGRSDEPRPARITNRRWAFSALGAAAGCALTSSDTVYCCLPLHHAAGMLVAAGGALVGGSRLALGKRFDPETFWSEAHRYGASVVFYAGDMLRPLFDGPRGALEASSPVRLFAGSGMRLDLWKRLRDRVPRASVLEFYASTEGNAVLANPSGKKVGSLGKPLPGSADLALLAVDLGAGELRRDERGNLMVAGMNEPGMLVARIEAGHAMAGFDGYEKDVAGAGRILRGVFESAADADAGGPSGGDAWFVTGDLMRRDEDGDYFFVDRFADVVRTVSGPIPTLAIEDALLSRALFLRATAYGVVGRAGEAPVLVVATVVRGVLDEALLSAEIEAALTPERRPTWLRIVNEIPVTDGYRPRKATLRDLGLEPRSGDVLLRLHGNRYVRATAAQSATARV